MEEIITSWTVKLLKISGHAVLGEGKNPEGIKKCSERESEEIWYDFRKKKEVQRNECFYVGIKPLIFAP